MVLSVPAQQLLIGFSILLHACFHHHVTLPMPAGDRNVGQDFNTKPHMKMLRSSRSSCLRSS